MKFLLRRFGFYGVAAFFAVTLNFFLPRLMPGDAAGALFARFQGRLSPEALEALRRAIGISDGPLLQQYAQYLMDLAHGDFGISISQYPARVTDVVLTGLGWTVLVAGVALVVGFALGTTLGVLAGWKRGGVIDSVLPPSLAFIGAFPYFWLAMGLLFLFGFEWRWVPLRHAYSDGASPEWTFAFIADVARHAALPVFTVVVATLGGWMMGMRSAMVAVLGTEYLALGRAKGLSTLRLAWTYAARNALLPNVTSLGMSLGYVLGGSLLTEVVFSYPGLGFLMVQAVRAQDFPVMQGLFIMITLAVLTANALVDVVTTLIDPRTRGREA
ncbi:MAG: ABC transporter permease [Myxococcaceae bacterium]|jgi:peptide/nickel transport system permease protein|nr:ABC transporter permease [Myxococcaceae bacterium]